MIETPKLEMGHVTLTTSLLEWFVIYRLGLAMINLHMRNLNYLSPPVTKI